MDNIIGEEINLGRVVINIFLPQRKISAGPWVFQVASWDKWVAAQTGGHASIPAGVNERVSGPPRSASERSTEPTAGNVGWGLYQGVYRPQVRLRHVPFFYVHFWHTNVTLTSGNGKTLCTFICETVTENIYTVLYRLAYRPYRPEHKCILLVWFLLILSRWSSHFHHSTIHFSLIRHSKPSGICSHYSPYPFYFASQAPPITHSHCADPRAMIFIPYPCLSPTYQW